jgi:HK97 family phage prohead protease
MLAPHHDLAQRAFRPRTIIDADGTVEGYASLFGEVDSARDMVMPGAFRDTLRSRGICRIPMLFQHDPAEPVGVWLELVEDWRGLRARGRLIPDVKRARELYALVKEGAVDGLSIGFRTVKAKVDPKTRVRRLEAVDLWEISIVTFPLLAGARVRAVKELRGPHRTSAPAAPAADERLLRRFPRFSFQRKRAEREWRGVVGAGGAPAEPARVVRMRPRRRAQV